MKMRVESIIYDEGVFYFVPKDINVLFSYSETDDQIRIIDAVPDEDAFTERQFNGLCKVNNRVVLAPYAARKIWIYDLMSGTWESVSVKEYVSENVDSKFAGCMQYRGKVYLFGYGCNGILTLDINTKELKSIYSDKDFRIWGQKVALKGHRIFIAMPFKKKIAVLDLETEEVELMNLDIPDDGVGTVGYDGLNLFFLPSKGNRYYVEDENNNIHNYQLPQELSDSIYNGIAVSDRFIYGYSSWGNSFIINRVTNDTKITNAVYYVNHNDKIGFIEAQKGLLNIYDSEMELKKSILLEISDEVLDEYYSRSEFMPRAYIESNAFNLSHYLKRI